MKLWPRIGRELWSLISDHEWNFDPYKVGGFGAFGFSVFLILRVLELVDRNAPTAAIGIVAGLVASGITMGTFLFSQARKSDESLMNKRPGDPGKEL